MDRFRSSRRRARTRVRRRLPAAGVFVLLLVIAAGSAVTAHATVPPRPGFNVVFKDDFKGASGSLPSSSKWLFDLGTGYPGGAANWGTGEVETMTNDPANVR